MRVLFGVIGVVATLTFSSTASAQCTEYFKFLPSDGAADDYFGYSVDVDGGTAVIGAFADDDFGSNSGAAYVFNLDPATDTWTEVQKLTADPHAGAADYFGLSVAIDGNVIVVGARYDDDLGTDSGSAFIFERVGGVWTLVKKLSGSDTGAYDEFGLGVAVDGDWIVVGAYRDDDDGGDSGSAYVFFKDPLFGWTEVQKLTAGALGSGNDLYGFDVAIQGDVIVVGAYADDTGSAYVYRHAGAWNFEQKLIPSDGASADDFGLAVAVHGDVIAVGAVLHDHGGITNGGACYVFRDQGGTWQEEAELVPCDTAAHDYAGGYGVAVGNGLVVFGSYLEDQDGTDSGAAYVYRRKAGSWVEDQKLAANDGAGEDWLGFDVALDGNQALVGAYGNNDFGRNSGSAYVYHVDELHLFITPTQPLAGDQIDFRIECGPTGDPVLLAVVALNGLPVFLPVITTTFGADYKLNLSGTVPPGIPAGLVGTFVALKLATIDRCAGTLGGVVNSNPVNVTF